MRIKLGAALLLLAAGGLAWSQAKPVPSHGAAGAPSSTSTPKASTQGVSGTDSGAGPSDLKQFESADLGAKLKIIETNLAHPVAGSGALSASAVSYLNKNLTVLRTDKVGQELGLTAVQLTAKTAYKAGAGPVWQLFQVSDRLDLRLACLDALAAVAKGNSSLISQMNQWLAGQNLLHITHSKVDTRVIDAAVRALGALQEPSSFQVLFATMEADYGDPVTTDARKALQQIKGDRSSQLLQVVQTSRSPVRLAALESTMKDAALTVSQKAAIATAALESVASGDGLPGESAAGTAALRFRAVSALGSLNWTPAEGLLLSNFSRAVNEYSKGGVTAANLVVSANALADMATHEAAVRLTLYLNLINSMTDKGRPFDNSITLAIVKDLGRIGDPVAIDTLFSMRYLAYPNSIKAAAREAVRDLSNQ